MLFEHVCSTRNKILSNNIYISIMFQTGDHSVSYQEHLKTDLDASNLMYVSYFTDCSMLFRF